MYRILLADDEGIMLESLKTTIESNFKGQVEIACAKTGRAVIELAETFRPDIAFMDIQMPGINGIQAMKEIQKFNSSTIFIVITAYDKFGYAQESINLGVLEYLTKPVNRKVIIDVLVRAMGMVEDERKKRSENLKIQEKLETVIPIIESGFIYNLLLQDGFPTDTGNYKELLDIEEDYGFMMVIQFGESIENGVLTNAVGMSVKAQGFYGDFREVVKGYFQCCIGPIMSNKIALYVPWDRHVLEYDDRIQVIEKMRNLIRRLEKSIDARFKAGIGRVKSLDELQDSYKEAVKALQEGKGRVAHIEDLPIGCDYDGDYPAETEKKLFQMIARADLGGARTQANVFFDWMVQNYEDCREDIQIKVLEFVMVAEKEAFLHGGMTYGFRYRRDYLSQVTGFEDYQDLRRWFLDKITEVCHNIVKKQEEQTESLVWKAKQYIKENYARDISLDDVSKAVNISPYYFSKVFKEEAGENFIEYLTRTRMGNAKEFLKRSDLSIKEICLMSGYGDPNYFSRIFKKQEGVTPSEYRERLGG